ncbi:hypothetical protein Y032_0511g2745 [Ancylostoma ceylanicum]|uniref:Uncharacterized protein n=1 Tax=Ancylostoma ceylanicum TaxID=53326 RepID=A0A016WSY0_9BILA|nr:hypothetical protein Y032_0511g2745 [Ancylostoma ceylanicum]
MIFPNEGSLIRNENYDFSIRISSTSGHLLKKGKTHVCRHTKPLPPFNESGTFYSMSVGIVLETRKTPRKCAQSAKPFFSGRKLNSFYSNPFPT